MVDGEDAENDLPEREPWPVLSTKAARLRLVLLNGQLALLQALILSLVRVIFCRILRHGHEAARFSCSLYLDKYSKDGPQWLGSWPKTDWRTGKPGSILSALLSRGRLCRFSMSGRDLGHGIAFLFL